MDDRYRAGFDRMLEGMHDAPTWDHVSATSLQAQPAGAAAHARAPRSRGLLVALGTAVATLVVVGAGLVIARGGFTPVAADTVEYVRLSWVNEVELRCLGMQIDDNGGFDQATIEIWGPNEQSLLRVDATAPDGTVERLIVEHSASGSSSGRAWSNRDRFEDNTVFRVASCVVEGPGGSAGYGMADQPITPEMHFFDGYVAIPNELPDGTPRNFMPTLATTIREDTWRGIPVTVFKSDSSSTDELGTDDRVEETWIDVEADRFERQYYFSDGEVTGTATTTVEVVERAVVAADSVSFSVEDLTLTRDFTDLWMAPPDDSFVATTSIPPTAHPLMAEAVEISPVNIHTSELRDAIDPEQGDQLFLAPVGDAGSLFIRLRAGSRPHMFATACSVLTSEDLPEGWNGTCLERTADGQRVFGTFSYREAALP